MYQFLVFLHIACVFVFLVAHGGSAVVAFRLKSERDPEPVKALLDLSTFALSSWVTWVSLLVVLVTGVATGIMNSYFGTWWIWISIVLFVLIGGLMTPLAGMFFMKLRKAAGIYGDKKMAPTGIVDAPEIDRLLSTWRPIVPGAIGVGGFVVILFFMLFKPF